MFVVVVVVVVVVLVLVLVLVLALVLVLGLPPEVEGDRRVQHDQGGVEDEHVLEDAPLHRRPPLQFR